jgi:hypothetical protein
MYHPFKKLYLLGIGGLLLLSSCGTYQMKTAAVEDNLFDGNFKVAVANIDQNKFLLRDRNRLLYLMEKGKIEYLAGNFAKSNALLEQADMMIDAKIKTSVGQGIASKLTNAQAEPYKGEDFEKVAIHYYKALNYFALGQPDEALVEAKRINIKLTEMNDKYTNNKNKYAADAFSQIVQGILYEAVGDVNNAFIAYRNAEELYAANNNQYYGVPMPTQLKIDLIRTAKQLNFTQEVQDYQKKFGMEPPPEVRRQPLSRVAASRTGRPVRKMPARRVAKKPAANVATETTDTEPVLAATPAEPKQLGEVVLFWENGLGPVKGQSKITVGGGGGTTAGAFSDETGDLVIAIPAGVNIGLTAIAIPKYLARESYYQQASITVDGKDRYFELSEDYFSIAKQCLKDRMMREAIDIALRLAAKKTAGKGLSMLADHFLGSTASQVTSLATDVTNVATEKADTRNWQTLPATISYVRIPVKEGDNTFLLKKYGPNGSIDEDQIHITGKPGLQVMSYFDLGRTIATN